MYCSAPRHPCISYPPPYSFLLCTFYIVNDLTPPVTVISSQSPFVLLGFEPPAPSVLFLALVLPSPILPLSSYIVSSLPFPTPFCPAKEQFVIPQFFIPLGFVIPLRNSVVRRAFSRVGRLFPLFDIFEPFYDLFFFLFFSSSPSSCGR